jgi:3-oxoacyl-[acyl-carrier-protein] synthase II
MSQQRRDVAITGVGVVTPQASTSSDFWKSLGESVPPAQIRRIEAFDVTSWGIPGLLTRRTDRFAQFALAAASDALADAGWLTQGGKEPSFPDPSRVAVSIGTGFGGAVTWTEQTEKSLARGVDAVASLTVPRMMPNAAAAAVSLQFGARGPCESVATACATGTSAIATGARWIEWNHADIVLAGAAEAPLMDTLIGSFLNLGALSQTGVSRPFDRDRDGFCIAEGAGVLVLEPAEMATQRGARQYALVAGSAATADAFHLTAPDRAGIGARRCLEIAMADAGVHADEVSHVNAHGTSTPLNDAAEAAVIRQVFGSPGPAVTSIKGVTGHTIGAAGALEAVATALAYWHRELPPTIGTRDVEGDIDVILEPRPWEPRPAMSTSFGFGGHNAALVFRPAGDF